MHGLYGEQRRKSFPKHHRKDHSQAFFQAMGVVLVGDHVIRVAGSLCGVVKLSHEGFALWT